MKTFLVISKIKTEDSFDQTKPQKYKIDEKGRKYIYVNTYLETWKFIIETNNKNNIYDYFKNTKHRVVNVQEVESFNKKNNKRNNNNNSSSFTLGEIFKDQLAEFREKNDQPYLYKKIEKQLKKKFLKEEKKFIKNKKKN